MRSGYFFVVLFVSTFFLVGCRENVQSAKITVASETRYIQFDFQFDRSQKSGTAELTLKNDLNQICTRTLPFNESDADEFSKIMKSSTTCSYKKTLKPCPQTLEESVTVQFRDGPSIVADLSPMTCGKNTEFLCGDSSRFSSLVIILALSYGDKNHRDLKCK